MRPLGMKQPEKAKAQKARAKEAQTGKNQFRTGLVSVMLMFVCVLAAFGLPSAAAAEVGADSSAMVSANASDIPAFCGESIAILNDNIPLFYASEMVPEAYVRFSVLDERGRTGVGEACLGPETLPAEERGEIGDIRPSGWHTVRYDDLIEDRFLYNRCHVIGYQLCGDNSTPENLFTGTRYLNSDSMLYFENMVAGYLYRSGGNHVFYRVTPVYEGNDLVARGVQMEAYSVEDFGAGICFNVFVYNVQPGIVIDYATGDSSRDPAYSGEPFMGAAEVYGRWNASGADGFVVAEGLSGGDTLYREQPGAQDASGMGEAASSPTYILNTNTGKFHYPDCPSVQDMKEKNKYEFYGTRDEAIAAGYVPCGRCKP